MYQRQKNHKDKKRFNESLKSAVVSKNISGLKSAKKSVFSQKFKNDNGETITSRKGIANVFGEFYSKEAVHQKYGAEYRKLSIKKGNEEDVGNCRPICILPALYKLLSTILYNRLYFRLDQVQAEDQEGFWRSYQAMDHLATYRMIEQKCHEWRSQNVGCDN